MAGCWCYSRPRSPTRHGGREKTCGVHRSSSCLSAKEALERTARFLTSEVHARIASMASAATPLDDRKLAAITAASGYKKGTLRKHANDRI
jgi:hypothetical protein